MRVLVFGNSGSGKSHYAIGLAREYGLARLDLDTVVWEPGREACLRNNARRPWERHKYASMEAQQSMLPVLTNWVEMYYERSDNCSYVWHRSVYDGFEGSKREITALEERP
ncbi:hypothetical protein ACLB1G_10245 [Oxalobacteraceae bacterium A2-2]